MADEIKPDLRDAYEVALDREEFGDYQKAAIPASGERPALGKVCESCRQVIRPKFGPGDYSCALCGFGMLEPCEHWKAMIVRGPEDEADAPPGVSGSAQPRINLRDFALNLMLVAKTENRSTEENVGKIMEMLFETFHMAASLTPAPTPSVPRCPKCGSGELNFHQGSDLIGWLGTITCDGRGLGKDEVFDIEDWKDFAQFFPTLIPPHPAPQPENSSWILCSERLPEIGENVLICTPSGDRDKGYLGGGDEWYDRFGVVKVIAWQPLPPAPSSQETPK